MKEVLYDIPVNDIFDTPCECPVCAMKQKLDDTEVAFAMGPSYMEDDIRLTTDEVGFCAHHMKLMYEFENRLGLALILNTHMQKTIEHIEDLQKKSRSTGGLFSKKTTSPLYEYTQKASESCFLCDRIRHIFDRYIVTTFYLYEKDMNFRKKFRTSKGFCLKHYGLLFEEAGKVLSGSVLNDFTADLNKVFLDNFKQVQKDVSWFVDKHDYRNKEKPWGNAKDALPRAMAKVNGISQLDRSSSTATI